MGEEGMYSTTDFYTTAVLIAQKFEVKQITTEGPGNRVKRFHFDDSAELKAVIMKYMNNTLSGNIREFRNAIETVKDMVHSG
jgi:hypothetical protein